MHCWLAALLLLPASWRVYDTPRAWLTALAAGPGNFFSVVVKSAPLRVRRSPSHWRNMLIYWPMKLGIDLVHSGSIRATAIKAWQVLKKGRSAQMCPPPVHEEGVDCLCQGHILPAAIRRMIRRPDIKVVSFDIFDTLLVRPALHPKDIFHLIAAKVNSAYGVDFINMRWNAEEETGLTNPTIHDIYAHIQRKYRLDAATSEALLAEEIRCETTLLAPREDIRACYDEAVKLGKRIIAVSDMYLPAETLHSLLQSKGYGHICTLYVSCEYDKRKSDGALYDSVIAEENVHPSEILHIGDNAQSDCQAALLRHITALHCPLPLTQSLDADPGFDAVLAAAVRRDPFWSLLWGFALHMQCSRRDDEKPAPIADAQDLGHFVALTLAPLLTSYCLSLAGDDTLRHDYTHIHFASRDGYLPHKVYTVIARHMPCLPAVYFHAGRRVYYPFLHDSFFDYAASLKPAGDRRYTLHDFILAHFSGSDLLDVLELTLSQSEKELSFFNQQKRCLQLLRPFADAIAAFMLEKRDRAKKYYATVFPSEEKRYLVFDLGYSGSIGQALCAATGKVVDKLYFWATSVNRRCDKALGSTTQTFMRSRVSLPFNLLFEEAFSPCAGGVIDFDASGQPLFEPLRIDDAFRTDMTAIHEASLAYAEAFCTRFGAYAPSVRPVSGDAAVDLCRFLLSESPFRNIQLFKNIAFPDPLHHAGTPSLERKMERFLPQKTVFSGTGFADPATALRPDPSFTAVPRLGMHIHLHNVLLAAEILRYLRDFPAPLDIYVTITDRKAERTVANLFSRDCIPNAKSVCVLSVPNRGRDIAPWVLGMRPYQSGYELFCHIHAKESPHFDFGVAWRRYLFSNLLLRDAMGDILALFYQRPWLGCLFPPVFPPLATFMNARGIPPSGLDGECRMACALLRRMGLRDELCRSELFFSMGSMLWYRPNALRQLFTIDLRLEEFAEEPIGVEGTMAHAIERLPTLLAERNGYQVGSFMRRNYVRKNT